MLKAARWLLPREDPAAVELLSAELRLTSPAARVLWNRGYTTAATALAFLNPRLEDLFDPFLLKDMDRAAERRGGLLQPAMD